jgi:transposase-like protein
MKYSDKFKAKMVEKLTGPGAISALRLSKECGVGQPTLSSWVRRARVPLMAKKPGTRRRKRWTPEEKLRVLGAAAQLEESEIGEFLRREGLFEADLKAMREELTAALTPGPSKSEVASQKRIKELERELLRKERALAETAALLVLRKKLSAYFSEGEVGDTSENSES